MEQTIKDPGFVANSEKLNLPIDFLPGDVVTEKIKAALNQPAEIVTALKAVAGS